MNMYHLRSVRAAASALSAAMLVSILPLGAGMAGQALAQDPPRSEAQVFRPAIGDRVMRALEAEAEGHHSEAVAAYDALLATDRLTGFEQASVLQLRGRAWYALNDPGLAIADWRRAIALNALPVETANILRINTGQLLLAQEEYRSGVFMIETALTLGAEANADIALRLAQGYAQLQDYGSGLRWAEAAFAQADPRQERHYMLLLFYYQALDLNSDELTLIRDMVDRWPEEKRYWTALASLLARTGEAREAFEVNAVMYVNGLLSESDELIRLAQYYAFYDYPYRGADILQRELNSGRIDQEPANYRLLASLWRQAREWDRAEPVLRRVATTTGRGADYEALGEALYQAGEFSEAEAMFVQALNRGGIRRPGQTWALLGNARHEQDNLEGAIEAFEVALGYDYVRENAQGWINFIESEIAIRSPSGPREPGSEIAVPDRVMLEECEIWIDRARGQTPTHRDEFDEAGYRLFTLPERCAPYLDRYGNRLPEWEEA